MMVTENVRILRRFIASKYEAGEGMRLGLQLLSTTFTPRVFISLPPVFPVSNPNCVMRKGVFADKIEEKVRMTLEVTNHSPIRIG